VIVNATASGLSKAMAERGVSLFGRAGDLGQVGHVCVLGAGFVLSYHRRDLTCMVERRGRDLGRGL
jgi:hypothetical protein